MMFEIKTGKSEIGDLGATIDQQNAAISKAHSKIETLSSDLSTNEADLKAAAAIREKDAADFSANEKQLRTVINSLDRSMGVLTKEMAKKKGGASMLQLTSADSITDALSVLVRGSDLSSDDASRVTAMMQENAQIGEEDGDEGQMERAESMFSGQKKDGTIGALESLLEKAELMLEKARKAESEGRQNFKMLRQSLTDELKYGNKDLVDCKKRLAEAQEKRAIAKGDLAVTSKDLKGDIKARAALHHDCMAAATEFEAATVSRNEELNAVSKAKKVIVESTGGAEKQAYGLDQVSLLEVSSSSSSASFKVVRFVRNLAHEQHSSALAQLASRMVSAVRLGATSGRSPFGKVKNMIGAMLKKLEKEGADESSRKAYCDKEMSETKAKKEEITTLVSGLTTKVDQRKAASSKLKDEVSTLQKELADMASSIGVATQMRNEEKAAYEKNKAEMHQGLTGIRLALKILRDYYAKDEKSSLVQVAGGAGGAGGSIIGFLEVVESDLTKGMAEMTAEENTLASKYKDFAQANREEAVKKQQDVKYKTREFKSLDKAVAELSGDLAGVQDERDAVLEYDAKIKKACIAKAEPYEEKKKRRDAEIAGLKEAIGTLEQSPSLLQTASKRTLRGSRGSQ